MNKYEELIKKYKLHVDMSTDFKIFAHRGYLTSSFPATAIISIFEQLQVDSWFAAITNIEAQKYMIICVYRGGFKNISYWVYKITSIKLAERFCNAIRKIFLTAYEQRNKDN